MKVKESKFISGNEAVAYGAITAGCRFFAGYPISPSSEIAENMSYLLPKYGGKFIQMEDEIASIGAAIGASIAGKKSMTATSGPGFSLKQENLGFACMAEIPLVVVDVMRGGPSTGAPTSPAQADILQSRWGTHGDHPIIVIAPTMVQEIFFEVIRAFNLAERFRNPVVLLIDEINGHMRAKVDIVDESEVEIWHRPKPENPVGWKTPYKRNEELVPLMPDFGDGARFNITGLDHSETGFPTGDPKVRQQLHYYLRDKIEKNKDKMIKNEYLNTEDAEIMVIAYGSTARSAMRAVEVLRSEGVKVGLFRPITLYPVPEKEIFEVCENVKKIVVPEMNLGQYVLEVERITKGKIPISKVNRTDGEPITPEQIIEAIKD